MAQKKPDGVKDTVKTVFYAILIALLVRTVGYEPFNIPSGSMIPTLLIGDYLFVSKFSYGFSRYSLPFGLPLIPGRILYSEPERGDVVVFKLPSDNSTDYIKRMLKREVYVSAYDLDEGLRIKHTLDPDVQQAVELLPKAAEMLKSKGRVIAQR